MLRNHRPKTGLEAKFSIEFAVAAPLVSGKIGLAELTDAYVLQPQVQSLFEKIRITTVDTVCPIEPTLALWDSVVLSMRDGRRFDSGKIFEPRGFGATPVTVQELRVKFVDCAAHGGRTGVESLFDRLMSLEKLADVRLLV